MRSFLILTKQKKPQNMKNKLQGTNNNNKIMVNSGLSLLTNGRNLRGINSG